MKNEDYKPLTELQREQISDLADGRLRGDAFAGAMALLDGSSHARAAWHGLHVSGDVLRSEALIKSANSAKDIAFLDAFRANLAKEPRLTGVVEPVSGQVANSGEPMTTLPIANESYFNWKWVGGLSAAAAAFVVSWSFVGSTGTAPVGAQAQLAQKAAQVEQTVQAVQSSQVETESPAGVMLRNPQLDALIAAHNQVGGSSALQMPSGFLRSATFSATVLGGK